MKDKSGQVRLSGRLEKLILQIRRDRPDEVWCEPELYDKGVSQSCMTSWKMITGSIWRQSISAALRCHLVTRRSRMFILL
jgi:hypothetical protein